MISDVPDLSAWGLNVSLEPMSGGFRNRVFREAGSSPRYVFKSTKRTDAALAWLSPVQDCARAAGFYVPHLMLTGRGELSHGGWTAEPYVAGEPADRAKLASLGPALMRFHALAQGIQQRPGFASARDFVTRARGGDVDLHGMPDHIVTRLRVIWALLPAHETPIHGDLNPTNVLITQVGPVLIDWDEARRDCPQFDLDAATDLETPARIAWEIACSWHTEPDYARAQAAKLEEIA